MGLPCGTGDCTGYRVLREGLQGAGDAQQLVIVDLGGVPGATLGLPGHIGTQTTRRVQSRQTHRAGGDGACLVQHHGVDGARGLQDLRAFDEDAHLGPTPGADQQGRRRGQTQRAGTSDDQHGDGGREAGLHRMSQQQPGPQGDHSDDQHHRHEDAGDAVSEALNLRLAGLGLLHEARHLRQLRVGPHSGGADHKSPGSVHGGPGDRAARGDLHRDGLAGEHGEVDGGHPTDDLTVGGDLLAGPDHEVLADGQLLHRHAHLTTVAQHGDLFGPHLQQ